MPQYIVSDRPNVSFIACLGGVTALSLTLVCNQRIGDLNSPRAVPSVPWPYAGIAICQRVAPTGAVSHWSPAIAPRNLGAKEMDHV